MFKVKTSCYIWQDQKKIAKPIYNYLLKFLGDMNNKTALVLHENPRTNIANAHHDGPILSWFIILLNHF